MGRFASALGVTLFAAGCGGAPPTDEDPSGGESSSTTATSGATVFTGTPTLGTGEGCTPTPTTSAGEAEGPACETTSATGSGDESPPVVTITHPPADLVLNSAGAVRLTFTVEDAGCVVSARLLIDGGMPRDLPLPPFEAQIEDLPWGTPELTVEVTDAAGNVGSSAPVEVRVCAGPDNPV